MSMTRRPPLRAVAEDEKPPTPSKPKSVTQAAADGSRRDLLVSLRTRLAQTVEDPNCPPRDLAALSRRLLEVAREIEAIDSASADDEIGQAARVPDEPFDASAI